MKYIIGIDEVGRGPLAGPVTVGVVVCESRLYTKLKRDKSLPPLGRDSKRLSEKDREKYDKVLTSLMARGTLATQVMSKTVFGSAVVHVSNTIIDRRGLSFAIKKAMGDGLKKLKLNPKDCDVRLDGGLRAPTEFTKQKTIIKGDEKEKIIAWASILAKVSRDALMKKQAKKFPQYGFERHVGYGTKLHREAISKNGLSSIHRRSFCTRLA